MKREYITFIFCILLLAFSTTIACSGEKKLSDHPMDNMKKMHWNAPEIERMRENPISKTNASFERGRKLYKEYCSDCHGDNGKGAGVDAGDLETIPADLSVMGREHLEGDLAWKIAHGKGEMPSWKEVLDDNQIWDLVNHIGNFGVDGDSPVGDHHGDPGHSH